MFSPHLVYFIFKSDKWDRTLQKIMANSAQLVKHKTLDSPVEWRNVYYLLAKLNFKFYT